MESVLIMRDSVHKSMTVYSVHEQENLSESNSFLQPPLPIWSCIYSNFTLGFIDKAFFSSLKKQTG